MCTGARPTYARISRQAAGLSCARVPTPSRAGELIDLGTELGILKKSGTWFSLNDERIGQGRENAKAYLREHPDLMTALTNQVREALGLPTINPDGTMSAPKPASAPEAEQVKSKIVRSGGADGGE